jgi:hypothetical protein
MLIVQGFKDVASNGLVKVTNAAAEPKGTKEDSTDKKVVKVKN